MTLHTTRPLLGDSFCAQTFRNKQINEIIAAKETKAKTKQQLIINTDPYAKKLALLAIKQYPLHRNTSFVHRQA